MDKIKFQIITPERVVFSEDVDQVSVMTAMGEITVLPHHLPLITVLKPGELRYKQNGEEKVIAVSGGFAEVKSDNSLVILADTAEHAEEIDIARAEAARTRAEKLMQEVRTKEDVDYVSLQASLEKALNRLKIGSKYRKIPPQMSK